jgi:hypothetical protein
MQITSAGVRETKPPLPARRTSSGPILTRWNNVRQSEQKKPFNMSEDKLKGWVVVYQA